MHVFLMTKLDVTFSTMTCFGYKFSLVLCYSYYSSEPIAYLGGAGRRLPGHQVKQQFSAMLCRDPRFASFLQRVLYVLQSKVVLDFPCGWRGSGMLSLEPDCLGLGPDSAS